MTGEVPVLYNVSPLISTKMTQAKLITFGEGLGSTLVGFNLFDVR